MNISSFFKKGIPFLLIIAAFVAAYLIWDSMRESGPGPGFAGGNGRIEATEIDVATKLAARVEAIFVREGDFVTAGQPLVQMQTDALEAEKTEATAQYYQAVAEHLRATAQVTLKQSEKISAEALVSERASDLDRNERRLARSSVLSPRGAMAAQSLDDDETAVNSSKAALASAKAQVAVAEAAIEAAQAEVKGAEAKMKAAQATIDRVNVDIRDSTLTAPRDGRIQYRVAQEGEVLGAGGKAVNMIDLADVYMTFFLPGTQAGRLSMNQEARLVLDAAPNVRIPAHISFVASRAQFTPKTVETENEREKLMFRVRAQVDPELLRQYIEYVKVGVTGVAWVRIDPAVEWPESLSLREPR